METNSVGQDLFQVILDDDEQVVQVLRPHKGRAWFSMIVGLIVWSLVMLPFGVCMIIFHTPTEPDAEDTLGVGIGALVFYTVSVLIGVICTALWCRKTVYAWTNKRVLIRTGYIGVDYKSLDLNMVGALSVNVNVVDKILRKNTGTKFNFSFVNDPYRVYKDVKAYIDQKKSSAVTK